MDLRDEYQPGDKILLNGKTPTGDMSVPGVVTRVEYHRLLIHYVLFGEIEKRYISKDQMDLISKVE